MSYYLRRFEFIYTKPEERMMRLMYSVAHPRSSKTIRAANMYFKAVNELPKWERIKNSQVFIMFIDSINEKYGLNYASD